MSIWGVQTKPGWVQTLRHDTYPLIDVTQNPALRTAVEGKTVLITGGGAGIGRAITESFAAAGAKNIIIIGRRPAPLEDAKATVAQINPSCRVYCIPMDIGSHEAIEKLFEQILGSDGPGAPDVLVNNAALLLDFEGMVEREWAVTRSIYEANVFGPYLTCRAFVKGLDGQKTGTIINVSGTGSYVTVPGSNDYSIAKTVLNRFVSCASSIARTGKMADLVLRHGEHNVIDNQKCYNQPGGVLATDSGRRVPKEMQFLLRDTPQLAGGTCLWLMTEDADFLKGRFLDCEWDMGELMKGKQKVLDEDLLKMRLSFGED